MKEVLIYGALVAAVLGTSVTVIQNLTGQMETSSGQITTAVGQGVTDILDATANQTGTGNN